MSSAQCVMGILIGIICRGCASSVTNTKCVECKGQGVKVVIRQVYIFFYSKIGPGMMQQMQVKCSSCDGQGCSIPLGKHCKKCSGHKTSILCTI